jgi:hypothetical protein
MLHPRDMGANQVEAFLTMLATEPSRCSTTHEGPQTALTGHASRFSKLSHLGETSIFATQHLYRPGTKSQSIISQNGHPFAWQACS